MNSQTIAAVHFLAIHQGVTLESTQPTAENRRGTGLARNVYTSVARRQQVARNLVCATPLARAAWVVPPQRSVLFFSLTGCA